MATATPPGPGAELRFTLLGPLEARRGEAVLRLGGRQQRAVLACLLVEAGRAVSVDRIADALWGDHLPAGYLTTVQTYVFHLREVLEPDRPRGAPGGVLVTVPGGGYRLDVPPESVDATVFEERVAQGRAAIEAGDLQQASVVFTGALARWHGDVLSDLADLAFVAPVANRLMEVRLAAAEDWAEAELALGRHVGLVAELGRLVEAFPLRERLHALRMLALYRSSRQAEALAAYREVRAILDEELGVEPGPDLQALHERILRQDPELAPRHTGGVDASAPGAAASPSRDVAAPLRRSGRARLAAAGVVLLAVGLIGAGTYRIARIGTVTPMPANSAGAVTARGLDGDAVNLSASPVALAEGGGSVWVVNQTEQSVIRVDPDTRKVVQTIHGVGEDPQAIATSEKDVWVVASVGSLTRIDIAANKVVATIPVGVQPAAVVASAGSVWVANSGDNTVQRIDPSTNRSDAPIPVGDGPDGLALDVTTLWVANGRSGTVRRIDTRTGKRIADDIIVEAGPSAIAFTPNDAWVTNQLSQSVTRIDRLTGRIVGRIAVDDGPSSAVAAGDEVWVANTYAGSVSRIDVQTNQVRAVDVQSSPRALARVGDEVWATTGPLGGDQHIGGTLTVNHDGLPDDVLDAAVGYTPDVMSMLRPVYDGLVAFRSAGGLASQTLVPDLAETIPRASDGGRTYVFTIRRGVSYSNGGTVVASDLARGVKRAVRVYGESSLFAAIQGVRSCLAYPDFPNLCDLSDGVVADDASSSLTLHLDEPDPDLLQKLAQAVVATPPGSPAGSIGSTPLPATGPYMISAPRQDGTVTLVRNPYFHQWSFSAQPQGFPDLIVHRASTSPAAAVAEVVAGKADLATVNADQSSVIVKYPNRVHQIDRLWAVFVSLNSHLPPFDDKRVRQALNYAVDRRVLTGLLGSGANSATVSCQLLPVGFPSYRRYCPYQTGPADGPYLGPDLEKAKALVRESGTVGVPIVFHPRPDGFPRPGIAAYVARVLTTLGYTVTTVDIDLKAHPFDTGDPEYAGYQIFIQFGWIADYPGAATFYDTQVSCRRPNLAHYCNQPIDAAAQRALALEATDPNAALEAWADVDRRLTDDAAFVSLGSTHFTEIVSERTGNYQARAGFGAIQSQLWVR